MESCNMKTGVCESASQVSSCCDDKCSCGGHCGGDPIKCAMASWKCAFHDALHQVMVDTIKVKIQKSFGPKMDKAADAVMVAMEAKWMAKMTESKAKMELMEKIKEEMMKK